MNQKSASFSIHPHADYISIDFAGYLEYGLIEDIKKELQSHELHTRLGYIIDMKNVKNIDSTGFGMIVNFAKNISLTSDKISIIVTDDFIRSLFTISQCDKLFPIVDNDTDALQAIKSNIHTELTIDEY